MIRQDGRAFDELRPIKITPDFVKFAEGSCLIQCGDTMVLCCASVEDRVPPRVPEGAGWVTAEYSMLPRAKNHPKGSAFPSLTTARDLRPSPAGGRRSALVQTDPP